MVPFLPACRMRFSSFSMLQFNRVSVTLPSLAGRSRLRCFLISKIILKLTTVSIETGRTIKRKTRQELKTRSVIKASAVDSFIHHAKRLRVKITGIVHTVVRIIKTLLKLIFALYFRGCITAMYLSYEMASRLSFVAGNTRYLVEPINQQCSLMYWLQELVQKIMWPGIINKAMKMSESPKLTRNVFMKQRLKCGFFRKIKQANPLPNNMKTDINPLSTRNVRSSESSHSGIDPDPLKGDAVPRSQWNLILPFKKKVRNHNHRIEAFRFVFTKGKLPLSESSSRNVCQLESVNWKDNWKAEA